MSDQLKFIVAELGKDPHSKVSIIAFTKTNIIAFTKTNKITKTNNTIFITDCNINITNLHLLVQGCALNIFCHYHHTTHILIINSFVNYYHFMIAVGFS